MKTFAVLALSSLAVAAAVALGADASKELAERRAVIASKDDATKSDLAAEHYRLGIWAKERGFLEDARAEFRAAVAADPTLEAAHTELSEVRAGDKWVSHEEAMSLKGLVERGGAWILKEEAAVLDLPAQEKARRVEEQAKVTKLLRSFGAGDERSRKFAEGALAGVDDKYKFEPLAWALRARSADERLYAEKELGRLGDRRGLRPLLWRAVHDPVDSVRTGAIAAAKTIGDPNLLAPLVGALMNSDDSRIRANAAQAIADVGDRGGVKYLVYRFEAHGGGAPRCYYSNIRQLSFIQDFDVEVAQTAFIADPQVAVIQEGFVLDVQVVASSDSGIIVEREAYHLGLQRLTGATDVKNEPGAWASWWNRHSKEYETASR